MASTVARTPTSTPLTVARALRLPTLQRGLPEVLAGHDGLDRPIRWVHAGEAPTIPGLLKGGEMLLTTGMSIGRRAPDQRRFVSALAERDAAALVIELGPAMPTVPPAMTQAADERGLPLVVLRREVAFVAVTEAIHSEIVNEHYTLLRRGEEIHRRLTARMLDGGGIPEVLADLAETLGGPVFLERADGGLLFHATPAAAAADPVELWEERRVAPGVLAARVQAGAGQPAGRLLVLEADRPLDPVADVALAHAAELVALALLRSRQEQELLARERGDLLADLVEGAVTDAEAARRAQALRLDPLPRHLLPVAAELRGARAPALADWAAIQADVERELSARGLPTLAGAARTGAVLLALTALRAPDRRDAAAEAVAAAVRAAVGRRLPGASAAVVAGTPVDWAQAGDALRVAAESAPSAGAADTGVVPVERLEVDRLLWRWRDDPELAAFVERVLGPLIDHDSRRKLQLLPTLEQLLRSGGRKAETARALHLNRQALYHRLARIEELLGVDLEDADERLKLQLAVRARRTAVR
ncbi:MAG TPA: PucR family transcriptional regulator [Capillimicrobium sp.]|nr:PucR family transcriptional regulator [Capillimicrobium sp.]